MIDLAEGDRQTILAILETHVPECEVWAFGSRVTGTALAHSDLDLAIICTQKLPLELLASIKEALAASPVPMRVDVLDWHRTSTSFQKIIEDQKEVFKAKAP